MAEMVEVCSYPMGSHKTNKIIEWMSNNKDEKFLYVIPNLSELQDDEVNSSRILSIGFETPTVSKEFPTKSLDLINKLENVKSVAVTHALYKMLDKRHLDLIKKNNMILVIDEEVNLIDTYNSASTADLVQLLNDEKVKISEKDGLVMWIASDKQTAPYTDVKHKHHNFYKHIVNEYIYTTRCTIKDGVYTNAFMTSQLTRGLIDCAKRVIVITYLFNGSILQSFLKLKGFKFKKFTDVRINPQPIQELTKRINLLPYDHKMKSLKLSSSWYETASADDIKKVTNFIRRTADKEGIEADLVMWTCASKRVRSQYKPSRSGSKIKHFVAPVGYTVDSNGDPLWLASNLRATNKYSYKKLAIHCYDRYPHVAVASYLEDYGCKVDKDVFAVSELLQWVFRANCRLIDGKITLAIASNRMYNLYCKWANGEFKDDF